MQDLQELSQQLGVKLKLKAWTLALAESCTGGLLAAMLTQIPGSSAWFDCGIVSYSNSSKTQLLHVPQSVLTDHGAVSSQTARLMAEGILRTSSAQIALSITGIAGPDGGTAEKPVGLVCFGLNVLGHATQVHEQHFQGSRAEIREQSVRFALEWLLSSLDK